MLARPVGQCCVATGKVFKMTEVRAVEAECFTVLEAQQAAVEQLSVALGTLGVPPDAEDHDVP
jgi:hypothetical protein